jgi:hypothetical protein
MQLMKAALPYMPSVSQKILSCYIKFQEFSNTMNSFRESDNDMLICSVSEPISPMALLEHLRQFCSEKEAETVDAILNTVRTFQMISSLQAIKNTQTTDKPLTPDALPFSLSKDQLDLFEQLSSLFGQQTESGVTE